MAFIDTPEDEQQQGQTQGQGQAPLVGAGSQAVGAQGGAGPAGRGGSSGGFVNIQNYLNANQGDTGSAQNLNKVVGGQFGEERSNLESGSASYLQDAQKKSDETSIDPTKAQDYLSQATNAYDWNAGKPTEYGSQEKKQQNPTYQDLVGKMQGALNTQYQGPRDYNYGFNNKTQEYGTGLKDNGGFDSLMRGVYSTAAQKPMTSGQFELQKQLDVGNKGLVDARSNLATQYDQLGADRDKVVTDTTAKLGGIADNYAKNQTALKDFLNNKSSSLNQNISQAEADARAAYNKEFTQGQSGYHDFLQNMGLNYDTIGIGAVDGPGGWIDNSDNGQAGFNWQDMQNILSGGSRINDAGAENYARSFGGHVNLDDAHLREQQYRDVIGGKLNDFYNTRESAQQNLGDENKRSYNALQDFLGLTDAERKKQGFSVTGRN